MPPVHSLRSPTGPTTKHYATCALCGWKSKPKQQTRAAAQRELDAHVKREHPTTPTTTTEDA